MTTQGAQEVRRLIRAAVRAVLETVLDGSATALRGVPEGHLYAVLSSQGITLEAFQTMVRTLVGAGYITSTAHLLSITDAGRQALADWKE